MAEDSRFSISRWARMGCWIIFWRRERERERLITELGNDHGNIQYVVLVELLDYHYHRVFFYVIVEDHHQMGCHRREKRWTVVVARLLLLAVNCLVNAWVEHFGWMASWWHASSGRETFLVSLNTSGWSIVFEILSKIRLLVYSQTGCWGRFRWLMK